MIPASNAGCLGEAEVPSPGADGTQTPSEHALINTHNIGYTRTRTSSGAYQAILTRNTPKSRPSFAVRTHENAAVPDTHIDHTSSCIQDIA